jgi:hypothetical protein
VPGAGERRGGAEPPAPEPTEPPSIPPGGRGA